MPRCTVLLAGSARHAPRRELMLERLAHSRAALDERRDLAAEPRLVRAALDHGPATQGDREAELAAAARSLSTSSVPPSGAGERRREQGVDRRRQALVGRRGEEQDDGDRDRDDDRAYFRAPSPMYAAAGRR